MEVSISSPRAPRPASTSSAAQPPSVARGLAIAAPTIRSGKRRRLPKAANRALHLEPAGNDQPPMSTRRSVMRKRLKMPAS